MSIERGRAVAVGLGEPGLARLSDALAEIGFELVGHAADGDSGLRLLRSLEPELVAVSAVMPGMDGLAFIERANVEIKDKGMRKRAVKLLQEYQVRGEDFNPYIAGRFNVRYAGVE